MRVKKNLERNKIYLHKQKQRKESKAKLKKKTANSHCLTLCFINNEGSVRYVITRVKNKKMKIKTNDKKKKNLFKVDKEYTKYRK